MLLSIFNTGGLTLALTIVWALLAGWFIYQTLKMNKVTKTPITKIPQFWFAVAVTVAFGVALLIVASDYKGV